MRVLVLGGIRSGKSAWAESAIARAVGPERPVRYVATGAVASDDPEWATRLATHRRRRPTHWATVEGQDVATELRNDADTATLVDDVGGWLVATLDRRDAWAGDHADAVSRDLDDLLDAVVAFRAPLALVSPEVGLTVVPATESGRRFADALGLLNQRLAGRCERVVLVVAGQPVTVKAPS